ncbi:MAG: hypothetical protein LBK02_06895 [Treponema sp.]|nr:hypothetical protein [Treponema sp.]
MKKPLLLALALLAVCVAAGFADDEKKATPETGGAGGPAGRRSIRINEPELAGFSQAGDSDLPGYIQGILTGNFVNYSGMRVVSWGDVPDYLLEGRLERHSATRYSLSLTVKEGHSLDVIAMSTSQYAYSLSDLKFGKPLNLATMDLFTDPDLGVKLTAGARRALDKPLDTKYREGQAALARANAAPEASFRREQNANVAEDLGASLARAGLQLSDSSRERFELPEFSAPQFATVTFKPPTIRTSSTGASVSALQAGQARYDSAQAASKAAIEKQQQDLLRQRENILDQWQNFLGEIDKRCQFLREEEQKIFQAQAALEAQLREGEADYRDSPPFRILYDPTPKEEADHERRTVNFEYQIATEPTSLRALKVRVDNLLALNKSFANVNKAYEDVNTVMAGRFAQVQSVMNAMKDAMERANAAGATLGQGYRVAPVSANWTVPPGKVVYGAALKTSWPVDYPRTFELTVCLLIVNGDKVDVIERMPLSLTSDISWNGIFQPESASARGSFNNVKIDDLPEEGFPTIWIEAVNGIDAETAAVNGYIETIPDGARTAAVGRQMAARESSRRYWSDTTRFNSFGVAVGTAGSNVTPPVWVGNGKGLISTPLFLVSAKATFSPFRRFFFDAGSDFGLLHGDLDIQDVKYLSIAPYLHLNLFWDNAFTGGDVFHMYIGIGGGGSFSQYTYPSESDIDPVTVNTGVFDFNIGFLWMFAQSAIDLRWMLKTNFKGLDYRVTLGYAYRLGYFAPRYGGKPADLTNRR